MKRSYYIFRIFVSVFFRDRVNLFMIFFFNAFLMIIFGVTIEDRYNMNVDLGVVNLINTERSNAAISYLESQPNIILSKFENDSALLKKISQGQLVAGIIIDSLQAPNSINLDIIGDPSRKMWLSFLEPVLKLSVLETPETINDVKVETQYVESNNLRFFDFIFPGLLIFSIMQIGMSGGVMLLVQRKSESLKRLQITPLKKWEFLLGYICCYFFIMLFQAIGYIILAIALFNYSFEGSYLQIASVIIFTSFFFILLGISLCNFCTTVENGNNFNRFFIFPASFLCGVFLPVTTMPVFVQKIALIHPLTHLVEIMRDISNFGQSIANYKLTILCLGIVFILISFLSIYTFRWQEKIS